MKKLVVALCLALIAIVGVTGGAHAGGKKGGYHKGGHYHKWKAHGRHKWKRHYYKKRYRYKRRYPYYKHYGYYGHGYKYCWKFKRRYHRTGKRYWLKKYRHCRYNYGY